ncbi:unnamed protein product [Kuraishia capsulata CBS 1993]|uniref:Uncharacterized protein n=1 Tax=Kuraishia capsulata CBS 1993 TaxID=1382522 RepID=W6MK90_9ASCO|nr:uncharacterized protein KUCA_T00002740001 [Kuraishia capsulata CBS 1993]CDK26766.1 unnamed protein product [Kuraishia capsulata CBS 1993]
MAFKVRKTQGSGKVALSFQNKHDPSINRNLNNGLRRFIKNNSEHKLNVLRIDHSKRNPIGKKSRKARLGLVEPSEGTSPGKDIRTLLIGVRPLNQPHYYSSGVRLMSHRIY